MFLRLLAGIQLLHYCLASYVAHVYWPRSIVGYYHIPVMQKMRYLLPAPEEVGHQLPAAVPVAAPPMQHIVAHSDVIDVAPSAVMPAGTVIAQQPYSAVQSVGYQVPGTVVAPAAAAAAVPAPMLIAAPSSGGAVAGYHAASSTDKQYSGNENIKIRVPKMAITPNSAPEVEPVSDLDTASSASSAYTAGQNAPDVGTYAEKPGVTGNYQPERAPQPEEQSTRYATEVDSASKSGYRLRRIVLQ